MKLANYLPLLCIFLIFSCARELDSSYLPFQKKVVLNGILQKDSLLKINLSLNLKNNDSLDFPLIQNAKVDFYENNQFLGRAEWVHDSYILPNYPIKENTLYKVVATIPEYGTVEAEDYVPKKLPSLKIKGEEFPTKVYVGSDVIANYFISFKKEELKSAYGESNLWLQAAAFGETSSWINKFTKDYCHTDANGKFSDSCALINFHYFNPYLIGTNSNLVDGFNTTPFISALGRKIFNRYIRFNPIYFNPQENSIELNFEINGFGGGTYPQKDGSELITIFNCSPNFDKYFKSVIINRPEPEYSPDVFGSNPFQEPASIHTNVKNGIGIFAGVAKSDFYIEKIPYQSNE